MVLDIKIADRDSAEKLNKIASETDEVLWIHADNDRIMVDARSLLGLYALVGMDCKLVAEDNADPKVLVKVAKKAGV